MNYSEKNWWVSEENMDRINVADRWQRADWPQDDEGKDAPVLIANWNNEEEALALVHLKEEEDIAEGVDYHLAWPDTTMMDDKMRAVQLQPDHMFWTPKYSFLCCELWSQEMAEEDKEGYVQAFLDNTEQGESVPDTILIPQDEFDEIKSQLEVE